MRFLITGDWHLHKYKILDTFSLITSCLGGTTSSSATLYVLQCECCGKLKNHRSDT